MHYSSFDPFLSFKFPKIIIKGMRGFLVSSNRIYPTKICTSLILFFGYGMWWITARFARSFSTYTSGSKSYSLSVRAYAHGHEYMHFFFIAQQKCIKT
jgi:hypothetical protein